MLLLPLLLLLLVLLLVLVLLLLLSLLLPQLLPLRLLHGTVAGTGCMDAKARTMTHPTILQSNFDIRMLHEDFNQF